jgi:hypothetical protein
MILEITNDGSEGVAIPFFTPVSIKERTAVLGGTMRIAALPGCGGSATVDIPL